MAKEELEHKVAHLEHRLWQEEKIIEAGKTFGVTRDPDARQQRSMITVTELDDAIGAQAACVVLAVPRGILLPAESTVPSLARRSRRADPFASRLICSGAAGVGHTAWAALPGSLAGPRHGGAAERGDTWLCSERAMYRLLNKAQRETKDRRRQREHPIYVKPQLRPCAPNQVWTRDYTKARGPAGVSGFTSSCCLISSAATSAARRCRAVPAPSSLVICSERRRPLRRSGCAQGAQRPFIADDVSKLFETLDLARSFPTRVRPTTRLFREATNISPLPGCLQLGSRGRMGLLRNFLRLVQQRSSSQRHRLAHTRISPHGTGHTHAGSPPGNQGCGFAANRGRFLNGGLMCPPTPRGYRSTDRPQTRKQMYYVT